MSVEDWIRTVAAEAQHQLDQLYGEVVEVESGSALDQAGLRDGRSIVEDYLKYGENGLAFDHALYMVTAADLRLSPDAFLALVRAGEAMGVGAQRWAHITHGSDA